MTQPISFRPGTTADSYSVFQVFEDALADLVRRFGHNQPMSVNDPDALAQMWEERRSLYEHLARTASHFWVAQRAGQVVGFARSIQRDDVFQLTELFVSPGVQGAGLGRSLLERTFPAHVPGRRLIIASPDVPALALYLKTGLYPFFPVYYLGRKPAPVSVPTNLTFEPIGPSPENMNALGRLDQEILAHRREKDHAWLLTDRQGFLYRRNGRVVGYGYVGLRNGPFALQEPTDFPAVLAHAERWAEAAGHNHFGVEVPMINRTAVGYLLAQGFVMEPFVAQVLTEEPFGKFDRYLMTNPMFFL